jgi:hypothetical protein
LAVVEVVPLGLSLERELAVVLFVKCFVLVNLVAFVALVEAYLVAGQLVLVAYPVVEASQDCP